MCAPTSEVAPGRHHAEQNVVDARLQRGSAAAAQQEEREVRAC